MDSRKNSRNKVKTRSRHHQPPPTSTTSRDKGQGLGRGVFIVRIQTLKPPHNKIGVIPCKNLFANSNNTKTNPKTRDINPQAQENIKTRLQTLRTVGIGALIARIKA